MRGTNDVGSTKLLLLSFAAGGALALCGCSKTVGSQASAVPCDVKSIPAAAPVDTTIAKVEKLTAPARHCRVDGYVTVTNPGPNKDYFRLQLPDKDLWKGRFYFIGLGGAAGYVPTDSQIPGG